MQGLNHGPDKAIGEKVNQRLNRVGLGSSRSQITVVVHNGYVTLSGTLQYDAQRRSLVSAARGVVGVRDVVDQLQANPGEKKWGVLGSWPITEFGR